MSTALDSTRLLGNPAGLNERLERDGYLAFADFFPPTLMQAAADRVCASKGEENINLSADSSWNSDELDAVSESDGLRGFLQVVMEADSTLDPELDGPEFPSFHLQWLRIKGKGASTAVHCDYHHVESSANVFSERYSRQYSVWVCLSRLDESSSVLRISPGSHRLSFDSAERGRPYPSSFDPSLSSWVTVDSSRFNQGTLVLMSMRLVHGATQSTSAFPRISWDARFSVPLRARGSGIIIWGIEGTEIPHWSKCHWNRDCHFKHPHFAKTHFIKTMLLVNARLRATLELWLPLDVLSIVLRHLCRICTPEYRIKSRKAFFSNLCMEATLGPHSCNSNAQGGVNK